MMIEEYNIAVKENIPPLILIPVVIHDFLCIHPFDDGNGRMSGVKTRIMMHYRNLAKIGTLGEMMNFHVCNIFLELY